GIRLTAPTVPWMVSSSVRPVNTRMVICFSWAVRVPQDGMSLDTGTFSGSQKLPVSRSQTSASFSSCSRFQLIAETRSISFILSVTGTPLHQTVCLQCSGLNTTPGVRHAGATQGLVLPCRDRRPALIQSGVPQRAREAVLEGAQRDVGEATEFVDVVLVLAHPRFQRDEHGGGQAVRRDVGDHRPRGGELRSVPDEAADLVGHLIAHPPDVGADDVLVEVARPDGGSITDNPEVKWEGVHRISHRLGVGFALW